MSDYIEFSGQITLSCGQSPPHNLVSWVSKLAHTAAPGNGLVTRDSIYTGS
jgi:hypothetical protein